MTQLNFIDPNPTGYPAVFLLHGLGADCGSWVMQMQPLADAGFRPVAPDAPGFGKSPYDGREWSARRSAAMMVELVEKLHTGSVHLVGLSMGGMIAQQFTLDYPHLVRKLVLVSTFAVLRPETWNGWFYLLQRMILVNTLGLAAQAKVVARRIFPQPQHELLRIILIESIMKADRRAYRKAMLSLWLFNSIRRLGEIKVPTLVVTGTNDTTVTPARQKLLVESIPGARQVIIPDAGHALSVDQSEVFNQVLLAFLKEQG